MPSMNKIKVRPDDMAKLHRRQPLGEYGPCTYLNCGCPEFKDDPASETLCANCHHERQFHQKPWHT